MPAPLPHPNIEPPPGAQLDSAALGAIFDEIQRNFDALSLGDSSIKREIVGAVSSAGAATDGTGFTAERTEIGNYKITLAREFPTKGIMVATQIGGSAPADPIIGVPAKKIFVVEMYKSASTTLERVDSAFTFHIKAV